MENILETLKLNKLKKTEIRALTLQLLSESNHALSHQNLEKKLGPKFDRVTLYRTLNTFEEKGIIHRIIDDLGVAQYALCLEDCHDHHHEDEHVHLQCSVCKRTFCLHNTLLPQMQFPSSVKITSYKILAEGVCEDCLSKTSS